MAGDRQAALQGLGNNIPARHAAQASFAQAFSVLMLVAAAVAAISGVLIFVLMGTVDVADAGLRRSDSLRAS